MTRKERAELFNLMQAASIELIHGGDKVAIVNATLRIDALVQKMKHSREASRAQGGISNV